MIPKMDQVVDIRSQSVALGSENFFSTTSAAKRLSTALRSWKLDTRFGSEGPLSPSAALLSEFKANYAVNNELSSFSLDEQLTDE